MLGGVSEGLDGELSGSLEDLVGNFDEKISHCLADLHENTQHMAPVPVRSQDEVMSESQYALFFFGGILRLRSLKPWAIEKVVSFFFHSLLDAQI